MKKLFCITLIFLIGSISPLIAMESRKIFDISAESKKRKREPMNVSFEEPIEIPGEVVVDIIMQMLPSTHLLHDIKTLYSDRKNQIASLALFEALQKIMKSLSLGHFKPGNVLRKLLINRIKEQGYDPDILADVIKISAHQKELFIAQIIAEAGGVLPYEMIYDGIRLSSEWGIKKLLALIQTLPHGIVDFNVMPYFDKEFNMQFFNPVEYIIMRYYKAVIDHDESLQQDLYDMLDLFLQWGTRNGYLRNMIHIDHGKLVSHILPEWRKWFSNIQFQRILFQLINKYDSDLAKELSNEFLPAGVSFSGFSLGSY